MTEANANEAEYRAEIINAEYTEGEEFDFRAYIWVKLHNPHGKDVSVIRTYQADPKYDDLVKKEEYVHSYAEYWWPDAVPANGDAPFTDQRYAWRLRIDIDDHDALLEACIENATLDAEIEIENLKNRKDRFRERLEE